MAYTAEDTSHCRNEQTDVADDQILASATPNNTHTTQWTHYCNCLLAAATDSSYWGHKEQIFNSARDLIVGQIEHNLSQLHHRLTWAYNISIRPSPF